MKFFNHKVGRLLFLLLQNRFVQILISKEELEIINKRNYEHNNFRVDYNFEDYQLGKNWHSFQPGNDYRNYLKYFPSLNSNKKIKILEIGPGSGYYSRHICEHPNVEHYSFYEINNDFKKNLLNLLSLLKKSSFSFNAYGGNFIDQTIKNKYDFIFFISSFHHIPNRKEYFEKCFDLLNSEGKIYFFEPTHYIFRIVQIIKKFFKVYIFYDKKDFLKNVSTHAFLTMREYKWISKKYNNDLIIKNNYIVRSAKINKLLKYIKLNFLRKFLKKYFSSEMITAFTKK